MSLYKYTSARHSPSFLAGAIRFQALAYYQGYEGNATIQDPNDGKRFFKPIPGLEIHNKTTGARFTLPAAFVSATSAREIFVSCLSTVFDEKLARDFGCDACVEIKKVEKFIERVRGAVLGEFPSSRFAHRRVSYYADDEAPGIDWALPESMVFSKRSAFSDQAEYRFCFGPEPAFSPQQTLQHLVFREGVAPEPEVFVPKVIRIGDLGDLAVVHKFRAA